MATTTEVWECPACHTTIKTCIPIIGVPICTRKHLQPGVKMVKIREEVGK